MDIYEYGNPDSSTVLLQMVDDHDLAVIENEVAAVRKTADDFHLLAIKVKNWNLDLSPWNAPAVFGKECFGGGAAETLADVLDLCSDGSRQYYVGEVILWPVCLLCGRRIRRTCLPGWRRRRLRSGFPVLRITWKSMR